jgi:hypothetical protein
MIRVSTGPQRSIAATLALVAALRAEPDEPVRWRVAYEVDRTTLRLFRVALAVGRGKGLTITDDGTQGLWYRRGRLEIRGSWQEVSRYMRLWQRLTGQR